MLIRPKMLRAGHVLPKIPWQIPIICRHKPKTKGKTEKWGEKAKEKKGNPENKSPTAKIFFFIFIISILLVFFYNRFFVLFYYYIFYYIDFYHRFIIEILLYFLLYRFY